MQIGRVHHAIALEHPGWARILEHLPGLNYTLAEFIDPAYYYPEFHQWTVYDGDPNARGQIENYLSAQTWTTADELYHLLRFGTYYGPYLCGIDPAINIGPWKSKYPLHSRFMHYFTPAVQAAVSILERKSVRGKLAALRLAREVLPHPEVVDMIMDALRCHYEIPEWYSEEALSDIERRLQAYLRCAYEALLSSSTLIDGDPSDSPRQLKARIAAVPRSPVCEFLEGTKFSRQMTGRLLFYGASVPGFDSEWLIRNELGRIVSGFYTQPLKAFSRGVFGEELPPQSVLERLNGWLLSESVCNDVVHFVDVASSHIPLGQERQRAREVAACVEPVQVMHEILARELIRLHPVPLVTIVPCSRRACSSSLYEAGPDPR